MRPSHLHLKTVLFCNFFALVLIFSEASPAWGDPRFAGKTVDELVDMITSLSNDLSARKKTLRTLQSTPVKSERESLCPGSTRSCAFRCMIEACPEEFSRFNIAPDDPSPCTKIAQGDIQNRDGPKKHRKYLAEPCRKSMELCGDARLLQCIHSRKKKIDPMTEELKELIRQRDDTAEMTGGPLSEEAKKRLHPNSELKIPL